MRTAGPAAPARLGTAARLGAAAFLAAAVVATAFLAAALPAACGAKQPAPPISAPSTQDTDAGIAPVANAAPHRPWLRAVEPPGGVGGIPGEHVVAARIFAFSDSQMHYLYGKRTFAQSPFADMSVEVAIRPAALDDGSDLLLATFLAERTALYPGHSLVFLGDAADLSCEQEYDAFFDVLSDAGVGELMSVTSNHDGFFVGNFTSRADLGGQLVLTDMPHDWTRACSEPGSFDDHRLTKGRSVQRLSSALPAAPDWATDASFAGALGPNDYAKTWMYYVRPLGGGDPGAPPVWGVFLDTVDYRELDLSATRGAGTVGAVSREQLKFLDVAMFNARTAGATGDAAAFVIFGHHPETEFAPRSRKRFERFLEHHPNVVAYVSAHTHTSSERTIALADGRTIPELVVGSTIDAPQQARELEVHIGPDGAKAIASKRLLFDYADRCRDIAPLDDTTTGYVGYRILRDSTPELSVSTFEKVMVWVGADDLARKRAVQGLGALVIENELVRSWARLYLDSPMSLARTPVADIVAQRYAAGADFAALQPWLTGKTKPARLSDYDRWQDPVVAGALAVASRGVHLFGAYRTLFAELRQQRSWSAESRHYFLCHAAFASDAERRSRRRLGDVLYIR